MEYQTLFCTGKDIDTLWKIKVKELVGIPVVLDHYVPSCGNYVMYGPSWSPYAQRNS